MPVNQIEAVQAAAKALESRIGNQPSPPVGVVLGTGLGRWAEAMQDACSIPYSEIDSFPVSTVQSHAGALVHGSISGRPVLALSGRFHLYEGYEPWQVVFGVRVLALLGVKTLILTNAAGALNPHFDTGGLMRITDHINTTGFSPLRGDNVDAWGPRFPDMSAVWDAELGALTDAAALKMGLRLERGVYVQVMGPQLETPAETRAFKRMGGDAIGMSTAIEAIAAKHMGLKLLGISCLTNKNLPDCMAETSIEEVIANADRASGSLAELLSAVIAEM
jgi:purine-nucleoside phosphorylase